MSDLGQAAAAPLCLETLEHISFQRSKNWGNFFNKFAQDKAEKELDLNELDIEFENDVEKHDENSDEAEEIDVFEDDDILQDITNRTTTQLQSKTLLGKSQNQVVRYDFTRVFAEEDQEEVGDDNEEIMQDILNQTRPLLMEQERKWKEAGIERILNTFDPVKIEEKVGGWLRRNYSMDRNSTCDNSVLEIYGRSGRGPDARRHGSCSKGTQKLLDSETESDSLHSIDTARYILSSRKRHGSRRKHLSSSSCTTTMTIKTFRMVKSKRDELRKKYACAEHDEAELHLNELRNRRAHAQRQQKHHHCHTHQSHLVTRTLSDTKKTTVTRHRQRSKLQTRKKRSASNSSSASSFASIERKHTRSLHPGACCHCNNISSSYSSHSSSCSASHCCMNRHAVSFQLHKDVRPWKRESECRCCNEDKLCKFTRHLADSSTDEWMVENCDSPTKAIPLRYLPDRRATKHNADAIFDKPKNSIAIVALESSDEDFKLETTKTKAKAIKSSDSNESKKREERTKLTINKMKQAAKETKRLQKVPQTAARRLADDKYEKVKLKNSNSNIISESSDDDIKRKKRKIKLKNNNKKRAIESEESDDNMSNAERLEQKVYNTKQKLKKSEKLKKEPKTNKKCTAAKQYFSDDESNDEAFNEELRLALAESEKSYKKDQERLLLNHKPETITNKANTKLTGAEERKQRKRQQTVDNDCLATAHKVADVEEDYKVPLKKNNMLPVNNNKAKSLKLRKLAKPLQEQTTQQISEATFLSSDNIYNSTALANDTAAARQFLQSNAATPKPTRTNTAVADATAVATKLQTKTVKRAAAVSTTKRLANASTASSTSSLASMNSQPGIVTPRRQLAKSEVTNKNGHDSDCTIVSSTTGGTGCSVKNTKNDITKIAETLPAPLSLNTQHFHYDASKGILLYTPHNRTLTPAQCFNNGFFNITLEHLSTVIGAKAAQKFFKYYRGQRKFDINSTIYFRPAKSNAAVSEAIDDDSSDSDDDELNAMFDCGDLHVSVAKANTTTEN